MREPRQLLTRSVWWLRLGLLVICGMSAWRLAGEELRLTWQLDRHELYVGEVTPITVTVLVDKNLAVRQLGVVELAKNHFAIPRFPLLSGPNYEGVDMFSGKHTLNCVYRSTLTALVPGTFSLGPPQIYVKWESPAAGQPQGVAPALGKGETHTAKLTGNNFEIIAKPLPEQGRPQSFSGAIGQFDFSTSAHTEQWNPGDPILVELSIVGTGNLGGIAAPALADEDAWRIVPTGRGGASQLSSSSVLPANGKGLSRQTVRFMQLLAPKKEANSIPPFEFAFFDPKSGQYVTKTSAPIPLPSQLSAKPMAPGAGVDLCVVADVSLSMVIKDYKQDGVPLNRLSAMKRTLKTIIQERKKERIALVGFAGAPYCPSPLTTDHDALLASMDQLQVGVSEDGTAIGSALITAAHHLDAENDGRSKVILLLTDGANNSGAISPSDAANVAATLGIKIYTVGVGTPGRHPIPLPSGQVIYGTEEFDEADLRNIASIGHGSFFKMEDPSMLKQIFSEMDALEKRQAQDKMDKAPAAEQGRQEESNAARKPSTGFSPAEARAVLRAYDEEKVISFLKREE